MSTEDCKEILVDEYTGTKLADWKRTSKKKIDGETWRTFVNTSQNLTVIVNEEEEQHHEVGEMYFAVMMLMRIMMKKIILIQRDEMFHLLQNQFGINMDVYLISIGAI